MQQQGTLCLTFPQYRQAGGMIDVTIFEGEGESLLRQLSSPTAQQALEQMSAFIHQHLA